MYPISSDFQAQLADDNFFYALRFEVTFKDNSVLALTNSDIWINSVKFEEAVSTDNTFQIGSAIINKLSFSLNNIDGDFSDYNFQDAVVVAYIGTTIADTGTEYYRRGTFIVDDVTGRNTSTINIECLDYMSKLDKPYSLVATNYPATIRSITQNICTACGVTLQTSTFYQSSYVVAERPDDRALTCRQVIAFVAQIACSFAHMDEYGRLRFDWYNTLDEEGVQHSYSSLYSTDIGEYGSVITGIQVTEEFPETETRKPQTYLHGTDTYVLDISGNDLIQSGAAKTVAEAIGARCLGLNLRYVNITALSDPIVQSGDTAVVVVGGESIFFPVTQVTFEIGTGTQIVCGTESVSSKKATKYSENTKLLIKAQNDSIANVKEYDVAMQTLTDMMSEAFGVFKTPITNQDGSTTYILHNKPNLSDSNIQWKMTAGALSVSTDYGQTWNAGIDASGNAVMNVLNAVGVNADWVRSGKLQVSDNGGNLVFMADLDTKSVYMSGDRVFIGDVSATDAISQLSGSLTLTLTNESQGIPVDSEGDYSTFPDVTTRIRVVYGGEDVTQLCTLTYSEFNMTGNLVNEGQLYRYTATSLDADTGYASFTALYDDGDTVRVQTSKRFNMYKVYAGEPGPAGKGTPARIYFIDADTDILKLGQDDEYSPSFVTFRAFYRDGNEVTRHEYTGMWKVEVTTDGDTWETIEQPVEAKTSTIYVPSDTTVSAIRCTLYESSAIDVVHYGLATGDTTSVLIDEDGSWLLADEESIIVEGGSELDTQSVVVVKDVSNLSQDQVFDILTNGGESQGLYLYRNKLYLNAEYMVTGILRSRDGSMYWNLDTNEVVLTPSAKVGSNGEELSDMQARITANATSISSEVTARTNGDSALSTRITQNANSISSEVTARTNGDSALSSRITQNANGISAEITNRKNSDDSLSARITANATAITTKITSAQAESIIEQKADSIRLKADKIAWSSTNSSMTSAGVLTCTGAIISGSITAKSGSIGGFHVTTTANASATTANGGHVYTTSLYRHSGDGTYEYEVGIKGDATEGGTSSGGNLAFYVKRITKGKAWNDSSIANMFYVTHAGYLYAQNANIKGTINATSLTLGDSVSIPYSKISSKPDLTVYVKKDGTIGSKPSASATGFVVSSEGLLKASNAIIYGTIYSSAGTIGGWTISSNSLYKIISSGGKEYRPIINAPAGATIDTIAFGVGNRTGSSGNFSHTFYVTYGGALHASGATISGAITATSLTLASNANVPASKISGLLTANQINANNMSASNVSLDGTLTTTNISGYTTTVSAGATNFYYANALRASIHATRIGSINAGYYCTVFSATTDNALQLQGSTTSYITMANGDSNYLMTIRANPMLLSGNVTVSANFTVNGTKKREVQTEDYGRRSLYCYEMASPLFGDVGEGVIGEDGRCFIQIDPVLSQTINTKQYQVFIQSYGLGTCYVKERKSTYFIVCGEPNTEFGWEIKAKQFDFDQLRLDMPNDVNIETIDYGDQATAYIENITNERIGNVA